MRAVPPGRLLLACYRLRAGVNTQRDACRMKEGKFLQFEGLVGTGYGRTEEYETMREGLPGRCRSRGPGNGATTLKRSLPSVDRRYASRARP